ASFVCRAWLPGHACYTVKGSGGRETPMPDGGLIGLIVLGVVLGLGFGYLLAGFLAARRQERDAITAETTVANARTEAAKILTRAEEEGRAKAEAYRERELEALAHRRLELSNLESRLEQREETLEQ